MTTTATPPASVDDGPSLQRLLGTPRRFRVPFAVGRLPLVPVLAVLSSLALLIALPTTTLLVGGAILAVGGIACS